MVFLNACVMNQHVIMIAQAKDKLDKAVNISGIIKRFN
jgi:hypothetical protein